MKKHFLRLGFFVLFVLIAGCATTSSPVKEKAMTPAVTGFPVGYEKWINPFYKSTTGIPEKDDCYFKVFVSHQALEAYKKEISVYPEGSVLVLEVRKSKKEGTKIVEGAISFVGVMSKYPNDPRSRNTGGWICAKFDKDQNLMPTDVKAKCFDCHVAMAKKTRDFVCSEGPH